MTRILIALFTCALFISGCSGTKRQSGGGYYKDDGPGRSAPANIDIIPDAVPRIESHAPANRRPYVVFGKRYVPVSDERPFRQKGLASWYGRKFHGNKTANGETYDMYAMTAAHPTLPLPSYARVTHAKSGKSVIVRINDRGPFHSSRIIDLSYVAAAKLDLIDPGSGPVIVEAITNEDIRTKAYHRSDQPAPKAIPIPDAAPPAARPTLTAQADTSAGSAPALHMAAYSPGEPPNNSGGPINAAPPQHPSSSAQAPENNTSGLNAPLVFLQYGAFSAHDNAHKLVASLNQEIAHIDHRRAEVRSSTNLHRVQIGPYSSRAQAVNAALRIQSETGREATYTTLDADDAEDQKQLMRSL